MTCTPGASGPLGPLDTLAGVPLHEAAEATGVAIVACDAEGRLTLLSQALQEMFGVGFEPLPEAELPEVFHLLHLDGETPMAAEEMPLARARAGEFVRDAVVAARDCDGELLILKCNGAPLRDEQGRPAGALVIAQDITAEREAARVAEDLRARLVRTVNHEFRTPLTALLGNLEVIRDHREGVSGDLARSLDAIERAGWRLRDLVCAAADLIERQEELHRHGRSADGAPIAS